jgi:hypothetical protein
MQSDGERSSHDRHDRKSPGYYPDKQLEELRSLQVRTFNVAHTHREVYPHNLDHPTIQPDTELLAMKICADTPQ